MLHYKSLFDHGFVHLEEYSGSDLGIANCARVSYHKHSEMMTEGDEKLVQFLLKNRHGTPFEQNFFKFHIKAPIFVFREWHRHRVGISINEMSGRYVELPEEFYVPDNVRVQVGKPGHYTYEPATEITKELFQNKVREQCQNAFRQYKEALALGIAKEQARIFLPVNTYSEMYWSCNARSLMHFLGLRNQSQAMFEIRQYAQAMEDIFLEIMPITARAFIDNGRVAP